MQISVLNKVIHGFEVELDLDADNYGMDSPERVSTCWIVKGGFGGSLEFLDLHGELINHDTGNTLEVSPHTIQTITNWAQRNGY